MKEPVKPKPQKGVKKDEKRDNSLGMTFEEALKKALNTPLPKKSKGK
jgi:hypothetical protein